MQFIGGWNLTNLSIHLQDMLPILTELRHALDMQMELETLIEGGNYFRVGFFGFHFNYDLDVELAVLFFHIFVAIHSFLYIFLGISSII